MKKNVCAWSTASIEISKEGEIDRWRISFYQTNPETGIRERFRPTFELNRRRIVKSGKREELANSYIQKVNELLPKGFPFLVDLYGHPTGQRIGKAKDKHNGLLHTPVVEALDVAQCHFQVFLQVANFQELKDLNSAKVNLRKLVAGARVKYLEKC